jgi:hypothetical protein
MRRTPSRPRLVVAFTFALLSGGATAVSAQTAARDKAALVEFFEKRVRPILANNCYNCHSATTNSKGGLRVDDRNGLIQGGGRGPAIIPGDPDKSLLLQAVRHTHKKLQMPPEGELSSEQITDLTQWIQDGAAWPKVVVPASIGKANAKYDKLRKNHWAWQPLMEANPPQVRAAAWARDDLDRFILARLEEKGLNPVGDAARVDLIRRVTFDLTGLPPAPSEVDAFVKDNSRAAFEKVVDRLLAEPAFGERWGRHWLDVARYG